MNTLWQVLRTFFDDFSERRCAIMAAALTYSTLLSLVPLLLVSATVLSYFPDFHGTFSVFRDFVLKNFVAGSAQVVGGYLDKFLNQVRVLPWKSIVALSIVSVLMVYNLVRAFNLVWQVRQERHVVLSLLIYLVVLLLLPIAIGGLLFLSTYLASLSILAKIQGEVHLHQPLIVILPYGASFITFTAFNWILPSCPVKLRYAVVAGLVTTVLFELSKAGFGLYLHYFNSYRLVYGALSTIPIFLLWVYLSWTMILVGALVCNILHRKVKNHHN